MLNQQSSLHFHRDDFEYTRGHIVIGCVPLRFVFSVLSAFLTDYCSPHAITALPLRSLPFQCLRLLSAERAGKKGIVVFAGEGTFVSWLKDSTGMEEHFSPARRRTA